tara:strand:+ start:259 stop:459 length:201 start_codon:yes stop_codon:yes gene_type:complete
MPTWLIKIIPTIANFLFGWLTKRKQDKLALENKALKHELWVKTMELQAKKDATKTISNPTDYLNKP